MKFEYKLSDIIDIIGGGTPKTNILEYWNGNIPWISIKDFNNDCRYIYKTEKSITQLGLESSAIKLLQKGDIIISARGTVGKIATIQFPMAFNQSCYGLRAKRNIVNEDFLYYLIKHNIYLLKKNTHGSVFDTITRSTFDNIIVNIPNLKEQIKISSILNVIDEKIELNNKISDNLLQQALIIYNSKIASFNRNGYIGDYCTIKSGFAFKSSWWTNNGIKVIKIGSINQDKLNLNKCSFISPDKMDKVNNFKVLAGDLIIAMTGATIGKFTIVPHTSETLLVNQRVGKFFLGDNPIKKLPFIYCTLKQPEIYSEIINRGKGSAQPNISAADIMSIPCIIPTDNIITAFNSITEPLFDLIISNQRENKYLSKLCDTLLPKLISNKFNLSNIDI